MRERELTRLFLRRFLDHDLVPGQTDSRGVIGAVGGGLVSLSLFLAVLLAVKYQFNMYLPPGLTSIFGLDDRFLLIAGGMLVNALLAAAVWDALSLNPRDTAVLGHLPIPRREVVAAKFRAVGILAAAVAIGWTAPPVLLRGVALPIMLPVAWIGVLQLMAALAVALLAATAFGFLAVLGCREAVRAVLGASQFARVSAMLQALLIVGCLTAGLLLPTVYGGVANKWLADSAAGSRALPPLWFVGLHERLGGAVLDRLPRTAPARLYANSEPEATARYRALQPDFTRLAGSALAGLTVLAIVTAAACAWNTRRLPQPVVVAPRPRWRSRIAAAVVARGIARSPAARAGFDFAVQTMWRSIQHRVGLTAAAAVGLAAVMVSARAAAGDGAATTIPLPVLAAQTIVLTAVVLGFRRAVRLPADARATWVFELCWLGQSDGYLSGVKRAGWLTLAVPAIAALAGWHAAVLGPAVALLHATVGLALSLVLIEVIFFGYRGVPFASPDSPIGDLQTAGAVTVVATVIFAMTLAGLERWLLHTWTGYAILLVVLVGLATALRRLDAAHRRAEARDPFAGAVNFAGEPVYATQRFDLTE